ncbi:hypothetical protein M0813_04596 [Anaeramoeba flamelloides]|uniref:Uncharacterized protein n=1 Tax=Anaeramoeba flamelloides TaxID=1746091 RepID=A0AAV7ZN46_9EUKA|nr:hypothetical protein M0812_13782 [Anaeramoeba flamelloides]KAJ6232789.1 hypothetical protein M0813_04596 [Anaeramoeba flamelloides]
MQFYIQSEEETSISNSINSDSESFCYFNNKEEEKDKGLNTKRRYTSPHEQPVNVFFPKYDSINEKEEERFSSIFNENSDDEGNDSRLFPDYSSHSYQEEEEDEEEEVGNDKVDKHSRSVPIMINTDKSINGFEEQDSCSGSLSSFVESFTELNKFKESLQSDIERELEKSFEVPLKRVPSWKLLPNYGFDY